MELRRSRGGLLEFEGCCLLMDRGSRDDSTVQELHGRIGSKEAKIVEFFKFNKHQILKCRLSVFEASSLLYGSFRRRGGFDIFRIFILLLAPCEACASNTTIVVVK